MKTSYNSILRPGKGGGATLLFVLLLLSGVFVLSAVNKLAGKFYFYATITVDDDGSADHTSIQAAIDAASAGDVIEVRPGTYAPTTTLRVDKALTIQGAGSGSTTINVGGYNAWGVYISASNVTFSGFTIQGDAAANQQFAFKVGTGNINPPNATTNFINEGLTVNDLVVQGTKRTGIDLNGVRNATLNNITSTGATGGFGMSISSSQHVTVSNITTSGNAWGDVGIFPANSPYQFAEIASPSGIVFSGTVNLSSGSGSISVQNGALQSGGTWVGTISNDSADNADVTVPAGFTHVVNATRDSDGLVLHNVGSQSAIHALAQTLAGSGFSGTTIDNLDNDRIEVLEGLSIQAAINAASSGDEIQVAAGTYMEGTLTVNKSNIKIIGPNANLDYKGARTLEAVISKTDVRFSNGVSDIVFNGLKFSETNTNPAGGLFDLLNKSISNLYVLNCIIENLGTHALYSLSPGSNGIYFEGTRISGVGDGTGVSNFSALNPWTSSNVSVINCLIEDVDYNGLNLETVTGATITGTIFRRIGKSGIQIANATSGGTITDNYFERCNRRYDGWGYNGEDFAPNSNGTGTSTGDGHFFYAGLKWYSNTSPLTATGTWTVTGNTFENNVVGYQFARTMPVSGLDVIFSNNIIFGNSLAGFMYYQEGGKAVNLEGNYWGATEGPALGTFAFSSNGSGGYDQTRIITAPFAGDAILNTANNPVSIDVEPFYTTSELTTTANHVYPVNNVTAVKGYHTIQAAIDAASPGDEIQVAPGTYAGFTIPASKSGLKLFGANEGTPSGGTRGPVSLVEGAVLINANGVTIDGFDIIGTNVDQTPALSKRGILVGNQASHTNVSILNNIIQDWVTGISLAGGGKFPWGQNIEIKGNLLVNNGIGSTENVDQLTIQDNNFNNAGIGLGGGCVLAAPISGNHFSNGGASTRYFSAADGVDLINGLSGIIAGNTFDKAVATNDATGSWYKQAIFTSFSDAINASASGAEIMAAAGEYPSENIALKDNLTIKGAQAGNDARLRGQTEKGETVIVGTGRIFNLASGVTLDGLYFRDLRHRGMDEAGKVVNDFTIKNSVLLSSAGSYQGGAIQIAPTTANNFTFENNYVVNRGGYLLYFGPGGTFENGTIKNNYINSHGFMFGPFNEAAGWVISGNYFDGTDYAAPYEGRSINAQFGNVQLANNKFEKQRFGPQISVIGGSITDNEFLDNKNYGIELWGGAWGSPVSTNVVISGNKFTYNGIPGSTEGTTSRAIRMGRSTDSPGIDFGTISVTNNSFVNLGNVPNGQVIERNGSGVLNATCNWWGSATASFTSNIAAGITYVPFLSNGTDNSTDNGFQNSSPCSGTFSDWCSDGIQSGNETGVDCGGDCIACPTCDDGIQNQGEIGIDCGGPCGICDLPVFVNAPADASIPYANAAGVTFTALAYNNGQTGGCAITGSVQPLVSRSFGICGGTITATWTFRDKCNRTVTHVQTLTVLALPAADWVNPPQNITITCKEFLETYRTPSLNYSNGLTGNSLIAGLVPGQREQVADACGTGFTETWSFTDFCGRNSIHTRFVTVTATCDDGIQNQGEIGVDCGGPNCAACPTCERPTGLYVNGISGNNATFNWTRVENVLTYRLQIRPLGSVNWTTLPSAANKFRVGGLVPNQSYEWRVLADCEKLDSDWSPVCAFTADVPDSGNCDAPENGPTCADGIQNQGEGGVDCGGPCDTACPTCDDGIQNQGEEGVDCGGPCAVCPPEVCVAPTGLEAIIDPGRARSVDLVWDAVSGAKVYEFSYRAAGSEAWITFPTVSTNSASIGALREGQTYEWRVKTICSKTESDYSLVCFFIAGQAGSSSCEPLVPTCDDGIQNQGEEGIDCGGPCAPCPTCDDGIQNQGETGVDCGGPCTPCPTCNDGIQNQGETGIDCGGPCEPCPPPACDAPIGLVATTFGRSNLAIVNWGLTANAESYLLSWRKVGNSNWNEIELSEANYRFISLEINDSYEWRVRSVCGLYQGAPLRSPWSAICAFTTGIFNEGCTIIAPTCEDGIQNQGETGVDCGGPCTPCPTCNDGIQNQGETGIDCGGPCTPCPTCDDGIQNGDETGVDCGGENCAPCETCEDGIQNQDEEGIDCGGENCAPCDCPAPVLLEVFISRGVDPDSLYWDAVSNAVAYKVEWRVTGAEVWNELDVTTNGVSGAVLNLIDGEMYEWRVRTICYFDTDINFYSTICFFTSNVPGSVYCDEESSCEDGIQNQGEEGIDCGGPCVPCASCEDGIQNQDEEGIDCGGSCEPCATCEDGIQNQDEEGIDCGGTSCIPCETCTDGVQNQGEEGVDCGGPCGACPECETPTGLDFERFGKLNMRVFWNEVTDATRYQIRLRILDSDTWTVANLTKTTYTASRLTLGAIYEWQVKTICGDLDLESEWSDVQYFMAGESGTIVPGGLTGLTTDKELLRVFPVPTSNLLNVSLNHEAISGVKLSLMDMTGNTVLVMPVEQGSRSVQLNVENLPRGIYFIKAEHETAVKVLRVVLQ